MTLARLRQLELITRYALQQFRLARQRKAFPIAQLHNLAWFAVGDKKLPTLPLEILFPGITSLRVQLERSIPTLRGNLTLEELVVVMLICRRLKPRAVFEFGTYNGRTTLNLALNTPADAKVYTLDLPNPGQTVFVTAPDDGEFQLGGETGAFWRQSALQDRIGQLWCDSAKFDETPYCGGIDLVFIDGAHSYEYVRNDSTKALAMVRPGGVIIWDDYCVWYPGVVRHLHELLDSYPVRHIEGTHLAILSLDVSKPLSS